MVTDLIVGAALAATQCGPRTRGCVEQASNGVLVSGEYSEDVSADSIYWQPPTRITASLDGTVLITVGRLANMARMASPFDQGWLMTYELHVDYYGDGSCGGPVIHANTYRVAQLSYKKEQYHVSASHFDQRVRDLGGAIKCLKSTPGWHGD